MTNQQQAAREVEVPTERVLAALRNRLADTEMDRAIWQARAEHAEAQVDELNARLAELTAEEQESVRPLRGTMARRQHDEHEEAAP